MADESSDLTTLQEELLALGRSITEPSQDSDAITGLLERYVGLFSQWYSRAGIDSGNSLVGVAALEKLESVHASVLDRAIKLRAVTEQDLKGLRKRERGILAYVDTLPKRLSIGRPKKG